MSIHLITMPDLGKGTAKIELLAWQAKTDNAVAEDQVMAEVMTDKARNAEACFAGSSTAMPADR